VYEALSYIRTHAHRSSSLCVARPRRIRISRFGRRFCGRARRDPRGGGCNHSVGTTSTSTSTSSSSSCSTTSSYSSSSSSSGRSFCGSSKRSVAQRLACSTRRGWIPCRHGCSQAAVESEEGVSGRCVCVCVHVYTQRRTHAVSHMHTVPHTHVRTNIRIRVPVSEMGAGGREGDARGGGCFRCLVVGASLRCLAWTTVLQVALNC
jgi:hypothetical protein